MPHIVAVFDPQWVIRAVIDTARADVPVRYFGEVVPNLEAILTGLRTRRAESLQPEKDESGCVTGYVTKGFGEEGYDQAVADECKRAGFRAAVISTELLPLIQQIPEPARMQVLPEVLFMEDELAREVLARMGL